MERFIFKDLLNWKKSRDRMPLVLTGARRVGKTWLMREFGRRYFKHVAYFSFDNNPKLKTTLEEETIDPKRFMPMLRAEAGVPVIPGETLIIFDEIQDSVRALQSLKYFYENTPEYHVAAAGSALGVMLHKRTHFPVGVVELMNIYPLTFYEFLHALGEKYLLEYIRSETVPDLKPFHDKLIGYLRAYMYVGGMPAAVKEYAGSGDYNKVRGVQKKILDTYYTDFSKYSDTAAQASWLRSVWNSVPVQLARENKKFVFGAVRSGARGMNCEIAIQWMEDSGLVGRVYRVTEPRRTLRVHEIMNAFKVYMNDVGLFSALAGVKKEDVADRFELFTQLKGALAEQYVYQELKPFMERVSYWSNPNATAEVDFLVTDEKSNIVPIEVKSGFNLRSKSLAVYMEQFVPKYVIRTSLAEYNASKHEKSGVKIVDVPLYAISNHIKKIMDGGGVGPKGEFKPAAGSAADWLLCEQIPPVFYGNPGAAAPAKAGPGYNDLIIRPDDESPWLMEDEIRSRRHRRDG